MRCVCLEAPAQNLKWTAIILFAVLPSACGYMRVYVLKGNKSLNDVIIL